MQPRTAIIVAMLGAGTVASADPCAVQVVRAPDAVRASIEAWVAREPACSRALEVRVVVEGPDRIYVFARDDRGRLHERVVPDADSAGVLVASWAADDSLVPPTALDVAPVASVPPAAPRPVPTDDARPIAPPGSTLPREGLVARAAIAATPTPRWFGVGAMFGGTATRGLRAELDVWPRGGWTLGLAAQAVLADATPQGVAVGTFSDQAVLATLGRSWSHGAWSLRAGGGLGVVRTTGLLYDGFAVLRAETYAPIGEASLQLALDVNAHVAITAGTVVQYFSESMASNVMFDPHFPMGAMVTRDSLVLAVVGGLRYHL